MKMDGKQCRAIIAADRELLAETEAFVSDMKQLLSPERVKAIWAGEPDPWDEREIGQ